MKSFSGRVAVVTGAAAGIGLAMAERFAKEGMKVAMADIDGPALDAQVLRLKSEGHVVSGTVVDVTSEGSVAHLATEAFSTFGAVHLLCNNAGIGGGAADAKSLWDASISDWRWALDVNVWGVIHGIRSFVPKMLQQGGEAHIINTASKAGLMCGSSLYATTKHTVVAMTEALHAQLMLAGSQIGVSVLCPGAVNTNLAKNSARVRLAGSASAEADQPHASRTEGVDFMARYRSTVQTRMAAGKQPADIADMVIAGLRNGEFYILPSRQEDAPMETRFENIRARKVLDPQKSYPQFSWGH